MAVPKVLLYSNRNNEVDEYARLVAEGAESIEIVPCRTPAELDEIMSDVEIVFGVHLPAQAYASAKKLRWIQSMWAGVEGLMSLQLPAEILITKPWGVFGRYLSHYVFGNLLALKINFDGARRAQSACQWQPYRLELLHGQCMGIAGMGDVAAEIAVIAKSFGMKVWALNSDGRPHRLADRSFSPAEKVEFVAGVDVLVLTLPATPATRGMFNRELLSHLQQHALIINVGRGALIEDEALIELLTLKKIGGAVLDVFQEEPLPENHQYWRLPNCIVTPHIGGPSLPADISACFLENLKRYQSGEPLLGLVDRVRGY